MTLQKIKRLRITLEKAHEDFLLNNEISADALEPALKFQNPRDKELVSFICSILAYGRIVQVKRNIHALIDPMGDNPAEWLVEQTESDLKKHVKNWKHRFNDAHDILIMLLVLQKIYTDHGSIEKFLNPSRYKNTADLLIAIRKNFYALIPKNKKPKKSFDFFIPDPKLGSASKRMNLYLKWMVRDTEPDLGLWKTFSKKNLIVPLDTHVFKQAKSLQITARNVADLETAIEITEFLKKLDVDDPTRYDFALCHLSINNTLLTWD
ncbi:MAG: TIGR02757 family protein [Bdellovibrionota bacterium]